MSKERSIFQFNPESTMWKVNRYHPVLLAGGRALHMQIAHPLVAQAVKDSGFLERNPRERLRNTARSGIDLIYGTPEISHAVADRINTIHARAQGVLEETIGAHPAGERYDARDQKLLAWVAATLMDSSIVGYETFINPLTDEEKNQYVVDTKELFGLVNLEPSSLPSSYKGLTNYIHGMIDSEQVKVGGLARELAPYTILSHTRMSKILMYGMRVTTIYLLPEKLQEQFGYTMPAWEKELVQKFASALKKSVPYMPSLLVEFKQSRDAHKKLRDYSFFA